MFEKTQTCSNTSSWSDPAIEATPQTGSFASTQMPYEPETKFELPSISNLKVASFTKGLQQLLKDQRPTKNTVKGCYASEENFSESLQPDVYTIFQSVLHDSFPPWHEDVFGLKQKSEEIATKSPCVSFIPNSPIITPNVLSHSALKNFEIIDKPVKQKCVS